MDLEGIRAKIKKAMRLAQKAGTDGERVAAERAAHRLAEIGVDKSAFERCLDAVYPLGKLDPESKAYARMKSARELVLAEFESGKTAQTMSEKTGWTAFNAFTYPIFNPEKPKKQIDMADIQIRGMNGTKASRVGDIFEKVERALVAA